MKLKDLLYHLKKGNINWPNIKAVAQAWFRKKQRYLGGLDLEDHIYEQVIWRRTQVMSKSPECWRQGACIHCGCEIIGKTLEDRSCSNEYDPCYPHMMEKERWEEFKRISNIKLFE